MHGYIDRTLHPAWYHGQGKPPPFFEGWYFKLVSADRVHRFAVIPGIFLSDDPAKHHAFIQVFDGVSGQATYHRFPADQFRAARGDFDLWIGANHFRLDGITLDIADDLRTVKGDLRFGQAIPWPVTLREPGVMGWFGWLPIMECYHGVLGMDHPVDGSLMVDGATFRLQRRARLHRKRLGDYPSRRAGSGRRPTTSISPALPSPPRLPSRRCWGAGFPAFWPGCCTMVSFTASPPIPGRASKSWKSTRPMSSACCATDPNGWKSPGRAPKRRSAGAGSPGDGQARAGALKASLELCLTDLRNGATLFAGRGECAGLEIAGDIDRLLRAI